MISSNRIDDVCGHKMLSIEDLLCVQEVYLLLCVCVLKRKIILAVNIIKRKELPCNNTPLNETFVGFKWCLNVNKFSLACKFGPNTF